MADTIEKPSDAGYESDFYLWTQHQAAALREAARTRLNASIDWENVAEEIESVGRSDRHKIESLTSQIIVHLLKLSVATRSEPRAGWQSEILAWRIRLKRMLRENPSLRAGFADTVASEWNDAFRQAETDLLLFGDIGSRGDPRLRGIAHFTSEQILDEGFLFESGEQQ